MLPSPTARTASGGSGSSDGSSDGEYGGLEALAGESRHDRGGWLRETPFWAVSAIAHLVLLVLLLSIAFDAAPPPRSAAASIRIVPRVPPPERPLDPTRDRALERVPPVLEPATAVTPAVERPVPEIESRIPEGSEDLLEETPLLDREVTADTALDALAAVLGAGAGDPYRNRGAGRHRAAGVPAAAESAIEHALDWLARHQSPDGGWRARDFVETCRVPCANLDPGRHGDGRGFPEHDVGVTGLAILAFTGYGTTHAGGSRAEWVAVVKRAARHLRSIQVRSADPNEDGRFGPGDHEQWIYDHAIATMAMAELLAMSGDRLNLARSVTAATRLCLRARNTRFAWRYGIQPGENDTSVTGWMVLALKAARDAGAGVPGDELRRAFRGALDWIDRVTSSATGKTGYATPGDEGSRLARGHPAPYPYSKELSCMTAVGVLCRLFSEQSRGEPVIKRGVELLLRAPPRWQDRQGKRLSTINIYAWYYASHALFQFGGTPWKRWRGPMLDALVRTQRRGGDENGSWDPIGEWGVAGGRVYATALGAMTLEVFYRFARVGER